MSKPNKISKEDFDAIQNLKANATYCKEVAKTAAAESRSADLEAQNAILRMYLKYEMVIGKDETDTEGNIVRSADKDADGNIVRVASKVSAPEVKIEKGSV